MRAGLIAILIVVVVGAIAAFNSLFVVNPMQQALVLQFGEVRQAVRDPGLNVKIPVVQNVVYLDKRVLDLNVPAQEIIASDQKRLVVDAFMRYRIADPLRFYQATQGGSMLQGQNILSSRVISALRSVLAEATFTDIVRDDRPQLMQRIATRVAATSRELGVEVVDVKIRRADLPEANSEAIYARMQTERQQEAREIRAQGQEAAQRVRAAADRTATVVRAEANRESEQIRGQGDARRNAIFAEAFGQDPNFFAFYRAMQAYEQALAASDTRLVLSPDADFFRYFNDPLGGEGLAPSVAPAAAPAAGVTDAVPPRAPAPFGTPAVVPPPEAPAVPDNNASLEQSADEAREALDADVARAEEQATQMEERQARDIAAAEAEADAVAATNPSIGSGAAVPTPASDSTAAATTTAPAASDTSTTTAATTDATSTTDTASTGDAATDTSPPAATPASAPATGLDEQTADTAPAAPAAPDGDQANAAPTSGTQANADGATSGSPSTPAEDLAAAGRDVEAAAEETAAAVEGQVDALESTISDASAPATASQDTGGTATTQ